jgi:hypothetical protein
MPDRNMLESLEEGFVFRVSRFFFLFLIVVLMLTVLGGAGFFIWGLLPVAPPDAAKAVTVTAKDVQQYIARNPVETPIAETPSALTSATSEAADQATFEALMDSLRQLLPADTYPWDEVYSETGEAITEKGINNFLRELFEPYNANGEMIPPLQSLVGVLGAFEGKERLQSLKAFVKLYRERLTAIREGEQVVQAEYENKQTEKMFASTSGGMIVASAIAGMAFTAMFLVLLSVQRSIKKLVEKQSAQ